MLTALSQMTDIFTSTKRSEIMSHIKSKYSSSELVVGQIVHALGLHYNRYIHLLPGKPDYKLKENKTLIFVNGCFWHQHSGCKRSSLPKTNKKYWFPKLLRNVEKQKIDIKLLRRRGWKVLLVWECQTKNRAKLENKLRKELCLN